VEPLPFAEPLPSAGAFAGGDTLERATATASAAVAATPIQPAVAVAHAVTTLPGWATGGCGIKRTLTSTAAAKRRGWSQAHSPRVTVGLGAAALLLLATCFTWYTFVMDVRMFGTPLSEGESYRGISYLEGKLVFVGTLAIGVWIGLGSAAKLGCRADCWPQRGADIRVVILLGLRSQLAAAFAECRLNKPNWQSSSPGTPSPNPWRPFPKRRTPRCCRI